MPSRVRPLVAAILCALALGTPTSAAAADVRTEHPRIYWTPPVLDTLRGELPDDPAFILMQEWIDRRIEQQDALPMLTGSYPNIIVATAAFVAAVLPEQTGYADEARAYLDTVAAIVPNPGGNLTATRNQLYALSLGYDWLYEVLDAGERTTLRNAIVGFTNAIAADASTGNYVSGPSRWANVVTLAGAVAIAGDDARLDDTLDTVLGRWRDGYNAVLAVAGTGGGHHMGWMYGPAYSGFEPTLMWRTASTDGETWVEDFSHDAAYFHIYASNGDRRLPMVADCFGNTIQANAMGQIAIAAGVFENPHAEAFYRELEVLEDPPQLEPTFLWPRLITRTGAPEPADLTTLPLSRHFTGTGYLVARDDWDRASATTMVFKASPFYSSGHHQRDEGSLYLDYRGPLLTDAGAYDGSGSDDHYRNFYSRSVAHNTLLVHLEGEMMRPGGFTDDGGQQVRISEAQDVAGMMGDYRLDGMVGSSDADACVWARTDTADTYVPEKLAAYTRDVLLVRRPEGAEHPALLVVDRAEFTMPLPASIVWHFPQNAEIEGTRIFAEGPTRADKSDGGRLAVHLLRPTDPIVTPFTDGDRWRVGDLFHPPADEEDLLAPYWGRMEVSPAEPESATTWSTLLRVGDEALRTDETVPVDLGADDWIGARLGNTLFAVASPTTTMLALPDGDPLVDGCVAGLEPGAVIAVRVGDGAPIEIAANGDGLAVFDPTPVEDPTTGGDTTTSSPADSTGGGDDGGFDDSAADESPTDPNVTDTSGGASASNDNGGCGCRNKNEPPAAAWWLVLLVMPRRRRA